MPKFDYSQLNIKERQKIIEPLVEALHTFKTKEQLQEFLSRLLTASEIIMLGRRLQVAEELVQGVSYATIREKTGVGFSTIQNVDSWLEHAVRDYHSIRAEHKQKTKAKKNRERVANLKPRNYRIHPGFYLMELLTQSIAATHLKK